MFRVRARSPHALAVLVAVSVACAAPQPTRGDRPVDLVARGEAIYGAARCGTCHEIAGKGSRTGPPLDHVGTVAGSRRAGMSAAEYLRQSILDPYAFLVPGYEDLVSRTFDASLSSDQVDALVAYLMSLQ